MRLPTALLLAGTAHATLWGWEETFTVVARLQKPEYNPSQITPNDVSQIKPPENTDQDAYAVASVDVCATWNGWCGGDCVPLQTFDMTGGAIGKTSTGWRVSALTKGQFEWARLQRENAAWIDLWRRWDGKWDMHENGKTGGAQGFCEMPLEGSAFRAKCPGSDDAVSVVSLVCHQY